MFAEENKYFCLCQIQTGTAFFLHFSTYYLDKKKTPKISLHCLFSYQSCRWMVWYFMLLLEFIVCSHLLCSHYTIYWHRLVWLFPIPFVASLAVFKIGCTWVPVCSLIFSWIQDLKGFTYNIFFVWIPLYLWSLASPSLNVTLGLLETVCVTKPAKFSIVKMNCKEFWDIICSSLRLSSQLSLPYEHFKYQADRVCCMSKSWKQFFENLPIKLWNAYNSPQIACF